MRKFLYMLAVLLVLIGISTNDVEARQDVYATTYLGNSWYVDQDSVKRVGDILNFTVYTTAGLSYKVTSSDDNYYNAIVLPLYAIFVVALIFVVGMTVDYVRLAFIEKPVMKAITPSLERIQSRVEKVLPL